MSLRNVAALKGPSSRSTIEAFRQQVQQNELPDVKFCLVITGVACNAAAIRLRHQRTAAQYQKHVNSRENTAIRLVKNIRYLGSRVKR
jgi:hypothetical protein